MGSDDAPESGVWGEGWDGELNMPGLSWTVQCNLVEMMYFCASHPPSHEMRARPVKLCASHAFDDGSDELKRSLTIAFGLIPGVFSLTRISLGIRTSMGEYIIRWETDGSDRTARHLNP